MPLTEINPNIAAGSKMSKIPMPTPVKRAASSVLNCVADKKAKLDTKAKGFGSELQRTKSLSHLNRMANGAPPSRTFNNSNKDSSIKKAPSVANLSYKTTIASSGKLSAAAGSNSSSNSSSSSSIISSSSDGAPKKKRPAWDLKGRVQDLEEVLRGRDQKIVNVTASVSSQNERIAVLEMMNLTLNQTVATKETYNQEVVQELDDVKAAKRKLEKELEESNVKFKRKVEELEDDKCSLQKKLKRNEDENELQCKEIIELKASVAHLTNSQLTVTTELLTTKALLEQNSCLLQEKEKCIIELKNLTACHEKKIEELNSDIRNHEKIRRKLHNTIQELKGNIRVYCRVRPKLAEDGALEINHILFPDSDQRMIEVLEPASAVSLTGREKKPQKFSFTFDRVFTPPTSQHNVFEEVSQLVQSALDGYNVCIFAYGQTGSGKTHTMEGPSKTVFNDLTSEVGVIPRAVSQIFTSAAELKEMGWKYDMSASFIEIYNETLRNLLDDGSLDKKYEIRMLNNHSNAVVVSNIDPVLITSEKQVYGLLEKAQRNRAVAATKCNERSSRSHSVFQLTLVGKNTLTEETCTGTLNLVDLAGSERLKDSGSEGERLTEAKSINKSLSNLGNVIMALSQNDSHIPYRNSKLTYLLMNSLGGNSKTLMFINVSPKEEHFNESLNSLRFAAKVNNCNIGTAQQQIQGQGNGCKKTTK